MGDFYLDLRDVRLRQESVSRAVAAMAFSQSVKVQSFDQERFSVALARVDQPEVWDPALVSSSSGEIFVLLAGRIALDAPQWEQARQTEGAGGLACKFIGELYAAGSLNDLRELNGNFVALIYDIAQRDLHIVTDRSGTMICYAHGTSQGDSLVFGSHPDILADAVGDSLDWDMTSCAQFLRTGSLSYPYTYYRNIRALEPGAVHTLNLSGTQPVYRGVTRLSSLDYQVEQNVGEAELAEDLASAFRAAVRRRTLPMFGTTGIALSGGLDSRAILSAAERGSHVRTFSMSFGENAESRTARRIAAACDVPYDSLVRDDEFYGRTMVDGVRISGGTGCVASNHFLGAIDDFQQLGINNLLTGCYCDYLFKGLALNYSESRVLRTSVLDGFDFEFYRPHYGLAPAWQSAVTSRLESIFPEGNRKSLSEDDWLQIERKRTFPLAYEADLAQRVIPQRVLPWYVPVVDNDVLDVYLRIPPRLKLGASLFRRMLGFLCDDSVLQIPDTNTGASVNAGSSQRTFHRYRSALLNRLTTRVAPRLSTRGSWPNWEYYMHHSPIVTSLWTRRSDAAEEKITEIMGRDCCGLPPSQYTGRDIELFLRLLTLKIWMIQRSEGGQGAPELSAAI